MNIYDLDLNLLKIFDAVSKEGSVSRAALRLGLTQPSVSHGLRRLRALLGDPLFVRSAKGVAPTAPARRLAQSIGAALAAVQGAIDESRQFEAASARRTFRLHTSDFGEVVFLPTLIKAIALRAPGVTVETRQLSWPELPAMLDSGGVDVAIGYLPTLTQPFEQRRLFREQYVLLSRKRGRRAAPPRGLVAVSSHPPSLQLLAELDLAVVVPRQAAERFARYGPFELAPLPGAVRRFDVGLHWSARSRNDPANRWLRELVVELFAH